MTIDTIKRHSITDQDRAPARALLEAVTMAKADDRVYLVLVSPSGERTHSEVPRSVLSGIEDLVGLLATKGEAAVVDDEKEVSPEEAAPLLGMSRPMVVHRMKQGDIPFRMVGAHHRLKLSDVLEFREAEWRRREALADFGAQTDALSQRHGI